MSFPLVPKDHLLQRRTAAKPSQVYRSKWVLSGTPKRPLLRRNAFLAMTFVSPNLKPAMGVGLSGLPPINCQTLQEFCSTVFFFFIFFFLGWEGGYRGYRKQPHQHYQKHNTKRVHDDVKYHNLAGLGSPSNQIVSKIFDLHLHQWCRLSSKEGVVLNPSLHTVTPVPAFRRLLHSLISDTNFYYNQCNHISVERLHRSVE